MIKEIEDKERVVRWIQNHSGKGFSAPKWFLMRDWLNGHLKCIQFLRGRTPCGWGLYNVTHDNYIFVALFTSSSGSTKQFQKELENYFEYKGRGFRFMTDRPKAWGRLWPGFKQKQTLMEKEF